jgi:alkylation response protein AidB-like acyl-CoA dehydrogenase
VRASAETRSYGAELWSELCVLGWPGIAIGEENRGHGLGVVELAILCEEIGYACAPVPFLGTAMASVAIASAGSQRQRERWLPLLATGELSGAMGSTDRMIPDGLDAAVIVLVDDDGHARVLQSQDADVSAVEAVDATRGYAMIAGDGEPLEGDVVPALARASVVVAAELVGLSQRALEMSVAYVKERKQFGRPVGAYQGVSHRCAQMLLETEGARSTTYAAAWAADGAPEQLLEAAMIAKSAASDAGREVTASAIQAHGGIGFTWEADLHWLYKRAQVDAQLLGGSLLHREKLAAALAKRFAARDT